MPRLLSLVTLVGGLLVNLNCHKSQAVAVPITEVRMTSGGSQSPLVEQLAEMYDRAPAPVTLKLLRLSSLAGRTALERGDADIMLIAADQAYFAHRDSAQHNGKLSRLRAMATLQVAPLYLLARPTIRNITDLRGGAIGTDVASPLIPLLLAAFEVSPAIGKLETVSRSDAVRRLGEGTLDAAFVAAGGPSPFVDAVVRGGAHLLPIEGAVVARFRRDYPFVRLVSIPAGTYVDQTQPIHTVGVEVVYVCRSDLSEDLAYGLTKRLFEVLPALSEQSYELRRVDVKQASATPIPLHEGAARYYREMELIP